MLLPIPPQPAPAASLISSAERRCRAQRAELGEGEEERRGDGETEGEGMQRQPFYRAAWKQAGTQDHAATTKTAAAIKKNPRGRITTPLWGLQTQIPAAASQCSQFHPPPFITPSASVMMACRAAQSEAVCVF